MMRSLYSAVSGLRVHQTKMDVIGNNIANVNTTGYKSSSVNFSDVFSQTLKGGTAASDNGLGGMNAMQIGLGSTVASIDIQMTDGASQRTDNDLDLQISGDGFFVVTDGANKYFTRAGAFRVDSDGNLVNSGGYKVCGWGVDDTTGKVVKAAVNPLEIIGSDTGATEPSTTSNITVTGNFNTEDGTSGVPITLNFYDSLGNKYTGQATATYDTTAKSWSIPKFDSITDSEGNEVKNSGNPIAASVLGSGVTLTFDNDGNLTSPTTPAQINFSGATPFDGIASTVGDASGIVNMDFSKVTQYSTISSVTCENDGNAAGSFSSFSVGADGTITAKYTNGDSKVLGQIALAKFKNPAGLLKAGSNLFETSANSGEFDGIGDAGAIESGVLEMSNVDLSKEFTEMITTQRGFQANSKVITASDEMLETLTNLKR